MPVHPRVCGERKKEVDENVDEYGSSPRVRGTHALVVALVALPRFIPACAGNALRGSSCNH